MKPKLKILTNGKKFRLGWKTLGGEYRYYTAKGDPWDHRVEFDCKQAAQEYLDAMNPSKWKEA